jgi:hypothetical protein
VQGEYFNAKQRSADEHYTTDSDPAKDTPMQNGRHGQSHDGCILAHASRIDPLPASTRVRRCFSYLDGTRGRILAAYLVESLEKTAGTLDRKEVTSGSVEGAAP